MMSITMYIRSTYTNNALSMFGQGTLFVRPEAAKRRTAHRSFA